MERSSTSPATGPHQLRAGRDADEAGCFIGELAGEFRLERVIGRGGMGTVFAARHPVIDKRAAVKVLSPEYSRDPILLRRFVDEARATNRICHPNIVDIFAFGHLDRGAHFLIMELLEGETLAERLKGRGLAPELAQRLLVQVAHALAAAHRQGIVHRDLKPENLFVVSPRHGELHIKVLDFGIAKLLEHGDSRSGGALGTPHFMSPEQCGGGLVDARSDIYALGVVLYLAFTGRLPFQGKSLLELATQHLIAPPATSGLARLSPALELLVRQCLEKEPARRPQSCAEVASRLAAIRLDARERSSLHALGSALRAGSSRRVSVVAGMCLLTAAASLSLGSERGPSGADRAQTSVALHAASVPAQLDAIAPDGPSGFEPSARFAHDARPRASAVLAGPAPLPTPAEARTKHALARGAASLSDARIVRGAAIPARLRLIEKNPFDP